MARGLFYSALTIDEVKDLQKYNFLVKNNKKSLSSYSECIFSNKASFFSENFYAIFTNLSSNFVSNACFIHFLYAKNTSK